MSVIGSNALAGASGQAAGGYNVERSLRFNSSDSAFCGRTFTSAGNRTTWSFSCWVKRAALGANNFIFAVDQATTQHRFGFTSADKLAFIFRQGECSIETTAVFRDPSAWYHILLVSNTGDSDQTKRIRIYVNGTEQATGISGFAARWPTSGEQWAFNNNIAHSIGRFTDTTNAPIYSNIYLSEIWFVGGSALTPSDFAETNQTTGQWIPKRYTGSTAGTNTFQLTFSDNSNNTATTLGKDYSPNGNNWTPNNLSVTAGAGNDSFVDTPTSYGTDTGAGGEVRGNYATLNRVDPTIAVLTNGNLDCNLGNAATHTRSTFAISAGKWYWEFSPTNLTANMLAGICLPAQTFIGDLNTSNAFTYADNGQKFASGSGSAYGASYTTGDIIGVAFDKDAGSLTFYKNGLSQGVAFTGLTSALYFPAWSDRNSGSSSSFVANFGQRPFAYTAPSGFKALCDTNLPAPVVAKPNEVMDVKLYSGNGSTQTISGLGFSPDFVWLKARSTTFSHNLYDVIRGSNKALFSDTTDAETTYTDRLTAFNSDGFSLGAGAGVNQNTTTYAAWAWDAGSSTVTNTQGSITSSVRANASAGFSIVTYTGTGANATVGHGLGVKPGLIIARTRDVVANWCVYHITTGAGQSLSLNSTAAASANTSRYQGVEPTSTVFSIGNTGDLNLSSSPCLAYCFAPVAGYSSGFSFTGNGSTDGPLIWLGFRARMILLKRTDISGDRWVIWDTARNTYNQMTDGLFPNLSDAELNGFDIDVLANGFKMRDSERALNASGGTYIGFAWAESPFQYARAR